MKDVIKEKRQTITRKYQIYPILKDIDESLSEEEKKARTHEEVNRVYTYIRDGMKDQNLAMNQYISALYMAKQMEISSDDRKELYHLYSRISESKKGSAYEKSIQFPKGLPTASSLAQKVRQDFDNACKKGLMYGKISLPTYRDKNPLLIHVDWIRLRSTNPHKDFGIYHDYKNHNEFLDALKHGKPDIYIKFAHEITFQFVFGNYKKSYEMRSVFQQIFEENYLVQGSSIQFDKSGKKIILNLSLSIPIQEHKLDEDTVVGVDLGINIPAVCGLNNDIYSRCYIGNKEDFLHMRTKIQAQKRRLQRDLKNISGGHGRKKKLAKLEQIGAYERNWVKTYNHKFSHDVVKFAIDNNAKYINIEDLSGYDKDEFVLRNWSYYELQSQIEYKAKIHGIEVRKINARYTSQVCSFCGHYDKSNRETQADFVCKNPECKMYREENNKEKNTGKVNADFNASRNIAKSTLFIDKKSKKMSADELMKQTRKYYSIPDEKDKEKEMKK